MGVDGDPVLTEIAVWRELPEPRLAAEREIDGAERPLVAARKALVLAADGALGVSALGGIPPRSLFGIAEFRLGEVDGDDKPLRLKARIFVEGGLFDIVARDAVTVEPVGGALRAETGTDVRKDGTDGPRGEHELPHHPVTIGLPLFPEEETLFYASVRKCRKKAFRRARHGHGGLVCGLSRIGIQSEEREYAVSCIVGVRTAEPEPYLCICDQSVYGAINFRHASSAKMVAVPV